uniref:Pheromone receptor a2 n=1 Tax=Ustanciosporium gigantosporum TaxID=1134041 RepID=H2CZ44_9BASI|nr:pheromone receptor a2 [Ustanciosporium gigantosporum]
MFSAAENSLYGTLCLLSAISALVPLPVQLRARNVGVVIMIGWTFVGIFNRGINALAFNQSLELSSVVGCDISAILERVWQLGLCCGCLSVLQSLERIASLRQAHLTHSDRRRQILFDLCIGLGLPLVQIPLFYIVQPHRLDLIESIGCSAPVYNSVPALFVYYLWRILISTFCAIYATLILRWFVLRRHQFSAALSSHHSGLSQRKYFRLFFLAVCEATLVFAGQLFVMVRNLQINKLLPYVSWAYVHADYNRVDHIPMAYIPQEEISTLDALRWLALTPGFTIFAIFGFSEDAKAFYSASIKRIPGLLHCWKKSQTSFNLEPIEPSKDEIIVVVHKESVVD